LGANEAEGGQGVAPDQPKQAETSQQTAQSAAAPRASDEQVRAGQPQDQDRSRGLEFALTVGKVIVWLLYAYVIFAIIILGFAFFLLVFGADPQVGFASFIYDTGARFMEPFAGLFSPSQTGAGGGGYFDPSFLFAIVAYAVLAWAVHMAYEWLRLRYYSTRYRGA